MTKEQIIITIVSSIFSGFVGVIVSTYYYNRYENRRVKFETFKKFMGNRYDLKGDAFSQALNEIFVVFKDSEDVMKALAEHHKMVTSGKDSEDELVKLFKAMCIDLDLNINDFNDSFFLMPYNTRTSCAKKL